MGNYSTVVLADSPVAYYHLDETSGTNVADSSGNSRTATITGAGVTLNQTGLLLHDTDPCFAFDGTGSYVACPTVGITSGGFSLECLMYCVGNGSMPDGSNYDTLLAIDASHRLLFNSGNHQFLTQFGGNFFSNASYFASTIYHVIYVYDSGANLERWYINGSQDSTHTPTSTPVWNGPYYIGCDKVSGQYGWNGRLDEVAIYTYALSPAQALAHYQASVAATGSAAFVGGGALAASGQGQGLAGLIGAGALAVSGQGQGVSALTGLGSLFGSGQGQGAGAWGGAGVLAGAGQAQGQGAWAGMGVFAVNGQAQGNVTLQGAGALFAAVNLNLPTLSVLARVRTGQLIARSRDGRAVAKVR